MTTTGAQETTGWTKVGLVSSFVALAVLLALTAWAASAGPSTETEVDHSGPASVEEVEGSHRSVVTLSPRGAEKIGLELARVEPTGHAAGGLAVPQRALVQGAGGTVWVYASAGDPLRFRRHVVEVAAVQGRTAILTRGPAIGTMVASSGSAELYGAEFEVGH